jgi:DNA polymerase-1
MMMRLHDGLVLEVLESEPARAKTKVPELMSGVAKLNVPLVVEAGVGMNWEEAH